jgi:hypothetical protein
MTKLERLLDEDPDFSSFKTILVALIEKGDPTKLISGWPRSVSMFRRWGAG